MRKILTLVLVMFFAFQGLASAADVVAVNYPPMMIKDGDLPGYSLEIIREANRRVGQDTNISFKPFNRAIKTVQRTKTTLHPALYRKPQREKQYLWIAKYHTVSDVFLTLDEPIHSLDEARKLRSIGVEENAAMDVYLTSRGFTNLERFNDAQTTARMLNAGRVNAWALTDVLARWTWKKMGLQGKLVSGSQIQSSDVYIVGGPDFSKSLAERYQKAVGDMIKDGTIDGILEKYQ